MIFKFTKVPKPKPFGYKPRFYDPEKEERDNRIARAQRIRGDGPEGVKTRLKGSFRRNFNTEAAGRKEQMRRSNFRLILIIAVLVLLTYFILNSNLPGLTKWLGSGSSGF